MSHAPALRCGQTRDITNHWFGHVALDPGCGFGFLGTADFADHHDRLGFRVAFEKHEMIEERTAIDRIAADTDARRDANSKVFHLRGRLVTERARTRYDADAALLVDVARHDAKHRLAGADDAGAVRANHQCSMVALIAQQIALHPHHVLRWNSVGDRAYELYPGVGRLHDRVGAKGRCDEGDAMRGARLLDGVLHGVEHRQTEMGCSALAGGHSAHDLGAIFNHFLGVERAFVARETLDQHTACFVNKNAHGVD